MMEKEQIQEIQNATPSAIIERGREMAILRRALGETSTAALIFGIAGPGKAFNNRKPACK